MLRFDSFRLATLLLLTLALAPLGVPSPAHAQSGERCFPETGFCISGRIRTFWEQNGALPVFGLPIGPQGEELIEGKPFQVQRFERNRLELHPENARPYDVLLGRLGADRLAQQGRDWRSEFPRSEPQDGCRFFAETGHNVCGDVLKAWRASGLEIDGRRGTSEAESLALFGLPLSDLRAETMADGVQRQVQWFERARFELHPANQPPYNVLLGLLGNELRDGATVGAPPPADDCLDVQEPVSARIRPGKCVTRGAILEIDALGFQPGERVSYWLSYANGQIVVGSQQTLDAGSEGAIERYEFSTEVVPAGIWYLVFQGLESGHQAVAYFKSIEARPAVVTSVPASQSASVEPQIGTRGTRFTFAASGFGPGESVAVVITTPDGTAYPAPTRLTADASGIVADSYTSDAVQPTGVWAIAYEGLSSGHRATAYFGINP